MDEAVCRGDQQ